MYWHRLIHVIMYYQMRIHESRHDVLNRTLQVVPVMAQLWSHSIIGWINLYILSYDGLRTSSKSGNA